MDDILLVAIAAFLISVLLIIITLFIIKRNQNKKYNKLIDSLDFEKNKLVGVNILSEISKVKDLVKTEGLQKKLDNWDTTFKLIKEERVSKLDDLISDADYLIKHKDYHQAVKKIANIEMEIKTLQKESDDLLEEIKEITNSEERNRSTITKLKILYRELLNKFERTIKDYGDVAPVIKEELDKVENMFQLFEKYMEANDYIEVEKIVDNLDKNITYLKQFLDDAPSIVMMATNLIPSKVDEATTFYFRMIRDGYPMDYLNVEYNLKEIKDKIKLIMDKLMTMDLGDSIVELKTMLDYFNSLYSDFDHEKECKDLFRDKLKNLKYKLETINKIVYDIYIQIDDIKLTYDLTDEEINKFSLLNKNLEQINADFKVLQDQGKGKTFAYSHLVEEAEGLTVKLSRLQDDLDYRLKSITSMQDDETRAKEQLNNIQELLKQSKMKLKDYKIPVIPNSYFIELKETQEAIREITKELDKKPIVIKILNIRVDTARDLVFKIYNKTNDMVKSVMLCERLVVYGNRYRSSYPEIDKSLEKAEALFRKGQYKQSIDISIAALTPIDKNILEKINI